MQDGTNLTASTLEAIDSMLLVCSTMKRSDICRFTLCDANTVKQSGELRTASAEA